MPPRKITPMPYRRLVKVFELDGFTVKRQKKVDYFITCDDEIIERYQGKAMKVVNPIDFVMEGRE